MGASAPSPPLSCAYAYRTFISHNACQCCTFSKLLFGTISDICLMLQCRNIWWNNMVYWFCTVSDVHVIMSRHFVEKPWASRKYSQQIVVHKVTDIQSLIKWSRNFEPLGGSLKYLHTECSLNIVFFRKFQNIFRTLASLGFSSVRTPDFILGPLNGRQNTSAAAELAF